MSSPERVSLVFVPGKIPSYTYNPRTELNLEEKLRDYLEEGGSILTLSGPTKTGKTVLVERVVERVAKVDGHGIDTVNELWARVIDSLGGFTDIEYTKSASESASETLSARANLVVGDITGTSERQGSDGSGSRVAVTRPLASVSKDGLVNSGAALVIDDFHFIDRPVQTQIVRALKPLVLAGVPVILVSISHRVQDVVTAEPDMTGRVSSIVADFWSDDELTLIAKKGFAVLNVSDPANVIANKLAEASYGSPHLMQRFCREICKLNGIRETSESLVALNPPTDWSEFFAEQTDGASADWFSKLLRGAQERGKARTKWPTVEFGALDYYGVTLAAIAKTGPKLTLTKDEIRTAAESVVQGSGPAANQVTRALIHFSKLASARIGSAAPTATELDSDEGESIHDVQPVLEYIDEGPSSKLHIADPFFAHFVRYGSGDLLRVEGGAE